MNHSIQKPMQKVLFTSVFVRIWHWINALSIVTLILTGLQVRFPEGMTLFGDYRNAVALHNTAGITACVCFLFWVIYYGEAARTLVKFYVPTKRDLWPGLIAQGRFYVWGFFQGEPHPYETTLDQRFNPLQKLGYFAVMFVLVPVICLSGLLLFNIPELRQWLFLVGGIKLLIGIHFLVGASFLAFLFVHIYLATMGHTIFAHFKPMWTGWETLESPHSSENDVKQGGAEPK